MCKITLRAAAILHSPHVDTLVHGAGGHERRRGGEHTCRHVPAPEQGIMGQVMKGGNTTAEGESHGLCIKGGGSIPYTFFYSTFSLYLSVFPCSTNRHCG